MSTNSLKATFVSCLLKYVSGNFRKFSWKVVHVEYTKHLRYSGGNPHLNPGIFIRII